MCSKRHLTRRRWRRRKNRARLKYRQARGLSDQQVRDDREFTMISRDRVAQDFLNANLLILRARILDSSVEGGMPSSSAAPAGPETFPLDSDSAEVIRFFS